MNGAAQYLGIDIAGADNTWIALLAQSEPRDLQVLEAPRRATLREIATLADGSHVVAAAIDAPLTMSVDDERGWRSSDNELRALLGADRAPWVASVNSLMAVPVRGQLIAQTIGPAVGTVLETHPRACLYFASVTEEQKKACDTYKSGSPEPTGITVLWSMWSEHFRIHGQNAPTTEGGLDALVCATVAYVFHHEPSRLQKLGHDQVSKVGRGPFYVLRPPP